MAMCTAAGTGQLAMAPLSREIDLYLDRTTGWRGARLYRSFFLLLLFPSQRHFLKLLFFSVRTIFLALMLLLGRQCQGAPLNIPVSMIAKTRVTEESAEK